MDLICADGEHITINDISYSPYLKMLRDTRIGKRMVGDSYRIDYTLSLIRRYKMFLQGYTPIMNEDTEEMFAFMGHPNTMGYPLDYWAVKLHDNWVRDHMYKKNLYEDPFYDLEEVPVVNQIPDKIVVPVDPNLYIAGGFAMWMAGFTRDYSDVDYFFTHPSALEHVLHSLHLDGNDVDDYHANISAMPTYISVTHRTISDYRRHDIPTMQMILRLYKAPTEIVHGFDLDSCGVILSHDSDGQPHLWATKRAMWSYRNKINWFDPLRASPSYAYRLSKYMTRGYEIGLVHLDPESIQDDRVRDIWNFIHRILGTLRVPEHMENMGHYYHFANQTSSTASEYDMIRKVIPKDPGSILILASVYHFHTSIWKSCDYSWMNDNPVMLNTLNDIDAYLHDAIVWNEQDPMMQVSSTRYPSPIANLESWWRNSPLVNASSPWSLPSSDLIE